ncbi:MAG: serpin family protein [Pseudonocardiales bacterium]
MLELPPSDVSRRAVLQGALGLLAIAGVSSLAGCASSPAGKASPDSRVLDPGPVDLARERVTIAAAPALAAVVAGMGALSAELHRTSATITHNWTISPFSIDVAFGMLRAGCRGSTAREIDTVFGYPAVAAPQGSPHPALNALAAQLVTTGPVSTTPSTAPSGQPSPKPIVAVANALFVDRTYSGRIARAFLETLATQYGAGPTALSFQDPAAAAKAINAWVARQTRDRITKLFDQLDPETVLVLANAVYLKASWLNQFSEQSTVDGPFTTAAGEQVPARLMHETFREVRYAADDGWQRVTLPYVGDELGMRVVVPTSHATSVAQLAPALAAASQPSLRDGPAWVDLTLPKWDTATDLPLVAALGKLGMVEAFTDRADLSGIAPNLFVSDAMHRANITVDESGTEAAAVTGIAVATSASPGSPVVMRADRPFAWAIVHEPTGTPIFTGHVTNPAAK